jgi:hypothetical protein
LPHILPTKEKGKYVKFFVKRSKYSISKRRRSRPVCQNDVIWKRRVDVDFFLPIGSGQETS